MDRFLVCRRNSPSHCTSSESGTTTRVGLRRASPPPSFRRGVLLVIKAKRVTVLPRPCADGGHLSNRLRLLGQTRTRAHMKRGTIVIIIVIIIIIIIVIIIVVCSISFITFLLLLRIRRI